ncbi:von Willebrand factor A domain-containing protein 5A [Tritrichomonas musculus]|uniref:von Willebrand factor A domain-containing protein 5A n=1 Tax=Tritrichomonas musculus TaxID=1915356 RepID=A0ABR2JCG4_9EUKA
MRNSHKASKKANFRQNIYSLFINNESFELTPIKIEYKGKMNNSVLFLDIHPIYKNDKYFTNNECILLLPKQNLQMIGGVKCLIDGKEVSLNIKEIEEEKQKQIAATDRNVISLGYQYFKLNVGQLAKGSVCDITINMEIISTNTDLKTYQTIIPVSNQILDPNAADNFSFEIEYDESMKISNVLIDCNDESKDFDYTFKNHVLKINQKPSIPIILLTELENSIPNVVQSGMNDEYFIISILPHFLEKAPKNDFIFITDCSGSMAGAPIKNVQECLSFFLHSLPLGCKFNIIRFGGTYECIFNTGELVDYNEQNLNYADNAAKNMKADLGDTQLYQPLIEAYHQSQKSSQNGKVVQIFTLTDGEIQDSDAVFQLVQQHNQDSHISSIGIGNSVDRDLVEGLAQYSHGTCDFVSDNRDISNKVMKMLSDSVNPEMKDISISILGKDKKEMYKINVNKGVAIHEGDMLHFTIKKNKADKLSISDIEIKGKINQKVITSNIGELHEYYTPYSSPSNQPISSYSTGSNPSTFTSSSNPSKFTSSSNPSSFSTSSNPSVSLSMPKSVPKLDKSLNCIISSQSFDGKWSASYLDQLIEILKEKCDNDKFESKIKDLFKSVDLLTIIFQINDKAVKGDIQSTIVAMCILNILYPEEKTKWALVEKKAVDWMKSQTQKLWPNEITNIVSSFSNPDQPTSSNLLDKLEKELTPKLGHPIDGEQKLAFPDKPFGFTISLKLAPESPVDTYAITLITNEAFLNSGGKKLDLQKADIQNNVCQRFFFGNGDEQSCIKSEAIHYLVWDIAEQSLLNPPEKIPVYAFPFHGRHNQNFLYKDNMIFAKQNGQVVTYVGGDLPLVMMFPSEELKERQTFNISFS